MGLSPILTYFTKVLIKKNIVTSLLVLKTLHNWLKNVTYSPHPTLAKDCSENSFRNGFIRHVYTRPKNELSG